MPGTPRSPLALARPASSALARPHTWGYRRNSGGRRKLSPRASRRAAEDFSSVEPLSPMAPPDALAAASYGCLVLAPRATLLCRCASAIRGCCPKPLTKGGGGKSKRPDLGFSRIGRSAPGASYLALRLGELRTFALRLGSLSQRIRGQSPRFFPATD